jgi:hypothetical protein
MRHLTRLFRQISYLITPPPCLISTQANDSFTPRLVGQLAGISHQ